MPIPTGPYATETEAGGRNTPRKQVVPPREKDKKGRRGKIGGRASKKKGVIRTSKRDPGSAEGGKPGFAWGKRDPCLSLVRKRDYFCARVSSKERRGTRG